ncbi:phosphonate ABC transporter, permease protein PhnE [Phenylobacterium sp.]|uniref:phosphonate ABC transporter, permease protein PhnE n=1 Tax=Phenylobacterium sp. TaxID=1871053 RepID=UPI00391C2CBD
MSEAAQDARWRFPQPYDARGAAMALLAVIVLVVTGARVDMDRMLAETGKALIAAAGAPVDSQVARGLSSVGRQFLPLQISERTEVGRIEGFDPERLPPFSRIETVETDIQVMDPATLRPRTVHERKTYLVQPVGYLVHVALKLVETLEIALWGAVLAVIVGLPLGLAGARNLTPHPLARAAARGLVSLLRAVPELISALLLVLAYGFGPIAGVLALGLHAAGFLGKFFAEEIENADPKPQEALQAIGANRLKVFRYAILPQVAPQYVAYVLYILDRNVRMATVIGLVGAGGIGQELKGRYDMYDYGHVGTILVAVFLLVIALDVASARLRRRWL